MGGAIAPIAMWVAIALVFLTLVFWGVGKIRRGIASKAVAVQTTKQMAKTRKLEEKTEKEVRRARPWTVRGLRDWLRGKRL